MTIQEANRALCEALEPEPDYRSGWQGAFSPLGLWMWDGKNWQPVDFINSEEASLRLLKAILKDGYHMSFSENSLDIFKFGKCVRMIYEPFELSVYLAGLAWKQGERPEDLK